jgi:uncharacterized protein YkwD
MSGGLRRLRRRDVLGWVCLPPLRPSLASLVFAAVNRERVRAGLDALAWDDALAREALLHSDRMRELGFFSHRDPRRGSLRERLGPVARRWAVFAENIYQEEGMDDPVKSAVASWMKSPGHRRNILDAGFTHTGVGVTGNGRTYWFTQDFGGPRAGSVLP